MGGQRAGFNVDVCEGWGWVEGVSLVGGWVGSAAERGVTGSGGGGGGAYVSIERRGNEGR